VIAALKKHLFNWVLWPDFGVIPNEQTPVMRWQTMAHGATVDLGAGRTISSHSVNHTVGSAAYQVSTGKDGVLFTGDMCTTPALWQMLAASPEISKVIVDCSFGNAESELAALSMHFCPSSLIDDISSMAEHIEVLIYHLKPGQEDLIMQELQATGGSRSFRALSCGDQFVF
jgi:cAMP phosphodiesterase